MSLAVCCCRWKWSLADREELVKGKVPTGKWDKTFEFYIFMHDFSPSSYSYFLTIFLSPFLTVLLDIFTSRSWFFSSIICIFLPYLSALSYNFVFLFHFSLFLSYSSSIYFSSFNFYLHVFCSQSSCSSASYFLPQGKCEMRDFSLSQLYNFGPHSSGTWRRVAW
jgi:hypothetical protein